MSEVVELVARAIYEASNHNKPYSQISAFQREKCEREARAAIEAMREPTDDMKLAGFLADEADRMDHGEGHEPMVASFQAMIDAALTTPAVTSKEG